MPAPDAAVDEPSSAVVPPLPFPAGLSLSMEAEIIAECLYHANAIQRGDPFSRLIFDALPSQVRAAYRDAAVIAIQRLSPTVHVAAVATAAAVVPGFSDGLAIYLAALQYGPAAGRS